MCIIALKYFDKVGWVGVKNRDRNYKPTIIMKQSLRHGIERLYLYDQKTKYTEGLNEYGVCILNTAVQVKTDETQVLTAQDKDFVDPDGKAIRNALFQKTPEKALQSLIESQIPGNTAVFTKDKAFMLEGDFKGINRTDYYYKILELDKDKSLVRTNHGILIDSGYDEKWDKEHDSTAFESSKARYKMALKCLKKIERPEDMLDCVSDKSNKDPQMNPIRTSDVHGQTIMVTTGQIMIVPSERTLHYRPIWCNMDLINFDKINSHNTKCFFEIVTSRKLVKLKEDNLINILNGTIFKEFKMEKSKFDMLLEEVLEGRYIPSDEDADDNNDGINENDDKDEDDKPGKKEKEDDDEDDEGEGDGGDEEDDDKKKLNEGKVSDKAGLKEYANQLAEKAFGKDKDDKKISDMVDNAIEKATKDGDTDWEEAAGIITGSFNS